MDNNGSKEKIELAIMANNIKYIKEDVEDIKRKLEADYITRQEFEPIKKLAYGLVALILTMVVTALIYLVIQR